MAVTGNTENVQTVLTIDTSKSASSIKDLRQQIKGLKDELVGLDKDSQAYADTMVVLGEKMHQLKEINEEIRRTNTDFGDTLGNVTSVMSGGVAAVQGLTAGLSLLGVEMGDDNKLTQTLVKSMALLQSLSTMDKAIKSFRALSLVIKSNIAAAGGLSKALKALAASNPFTIMLVAATALVGVIAAIVGKEKEAKTETEIHEDAVKALTLQYYNLADAMNGLDNARAWNSDSKIQKGVTDLENKFRSFANQVGNRGRDIQKVWEDFYNQIMTTGSKAEKQLVGMANAQYNYNEAVAEMNRIRQYSPGEGGWIESEAQKQEMIKEQQKNINQLYTQRNSLYKTYLDNQKKDSKNTKDLEKEKYDLALKRLNLQKTIDETNLASRYAEEKRAAQGNAAALLEIEKKYQEERTKLNEQYYQSAIELAENFRKTRKKEGDIADVDQTIANLNKSLQEGTSAWEEYKAENASANIELAKTKLEAQANIDSLDRQTASMEREIEITKQHNERYLQLISDKWTLQADLDAEAIRYQQEQLQNSNLNIEDDLAALRTKHEAEMELLQEQYDQKLIAEEEFQQQKAELEAQYNNDSMSLLQQHFENEAALDELAVEAKKNETEKKKELEQTYMSAISSISSSITAVLNEAANAEDVSFEDQKKLKIASTIITTLTSAMEAFQSVASIPVVGPALGAAAAASTIAIGMMQVNKIRQTKKNSTSSNASVSTGAITAVQSPAQIVNLNAMNDEITLPDQKVYVVESDITAAQNRVQVVESNSEI